MKNRTLPKSLSKKKIYTLKNNDLILILDGYRNRPLVTTIDNIISERSNCIKATYNGYQWDIPHCCIIKILNKNTNPEYYL